MSQTQIASCTVSYFLNHQETTDPDWAHFRNSDSIIALLGAEHTVETGGDHNAVQITGLIHCH